MPPKIYIFLSLSFVNKTGSKLPLIFLMNYANIFCSVMIVDPLIGLHGLNNIDKGLLIIETNLIVRSTWLFFKFIFLFEAISAKSRRGQ